MTHLIAIRTSLAKGGIPFETVYLGVTKSDKSPSLLGIFLYQRAEVRPRMACPFSVVVAIDFGTTSSGYAFSFTQDSDAIHMMR